MILKRSYATTVLAAAATALTLSVAPQAAAAPSGLLCANTGAGATVCQSTGNAQISAAPTDKAEAQYIPLGLLFHHGGHRR